MKSWQIYIFKWLEPIIHNIVTILLQYCYGKSVTTGNYVLVIRANQNQPDLHACDLLYLNTTFVY